MNIRRNRIRWDFPPAQKFRMELLLAENEDLREAVTRLQEQVSSWESFYDWMNDEGRIHEHELPLP